jgi:wyosine [tRNA(Phe)-imidazoG37] synthetase (radical SAM superfamily)
MPNAPRRGKPGWGDGVKDNGRPHIFGPVPSRRLGRSLGVDPIPFKTCCYDCVYCQLGRTTNLTGERKAYVAATTLIGELEAWLARDETADYITLSGSGEPTLSTEIGEVIAWAQAHTQIPVAVLTNGGLLWRADVRWQVAKADLLIPSLDAATEDVFRRVNRPAPGLELAEVINGLVAARSECRGQIWLEVMLVAGLNDSDEHLRALRDAIDRIGPQRVQVNTVVRPGAEPIAQAVSQDVLDRARQLLGPSAEVVVPRSEHPGSYAPTSGVRDVLALLHRRPCTLGDVADGLGLHLNEVAKHMEALLERSAVRAVVEAGTTYYAAADELPESSPE